MATFHDIWPDWEIGVKRMPTAVDQRQKEHDAVKDDL
jgi:hypothetical protein